MATNTSSPPDFDFNATCRFFKSSFARTLSLNNGSCGSNNSNNNNNANSFKSLEFDLNQHFKRNNNSIYNNNNNEFNVNQCSKTENGLEVANKQRPQAKRTTIEVTSNMDIDVKNEVTSSLDVDNNDDGNAEFVLDSDVDVDDTDGDEQKNKVISTATCGTIVLQKTDSNKHKQPQILPLKLPQQQQQQKLPAHLRPESSEITTFNKVLKNATTIATTTTTQQKQQQQATVPQWQLYKQLDDINENNSTMATTTTLLKNQNHSFNRKSVWSRNINNNKQNFNTNRLIEAESTEMSTDVSTNNRNKNYNMKSLNTMLPDNSASKVETVLLRNQVDTLQWQLKQVETSCEMYRAVMQEVARFLERYQTHKQQQRLNQNSMEQISRSKSLYQVYAAYCDNKSSTLSADETSQAANHLRAHSSHNLIEINGRVTKTTSATALEATAAPALPVIGRQANDHNPYSAFKDFTWRRSPKKPNASNCQPAFDDAEEKLSQEGFRLFRTIQNLLNTSIQQPDLTQHRQSLSAINMQRLSNTATTITNNNNNKNNSNNNVENMKFERAKITADVPQNVHINTLPKPKTALSTVADMLFMRSNNMRDSRLSVRSSTDSSVHSTTSSASSSSASTSSCTSSKVETDEEATISPTIKPTVGGSTTEDESGFSSINSFQDVGMPAFSSTLIERRPSSISSASVRPKSMPPQQSEHPNNIVGLPDAATHVWDVKSTPLRNNPGYQITRKFQRYSTISTEETGTVLWV